MVSAVSWSLLGLTAVAVALEVVYRFLTRRRPVREVLFFPAPLVCTEPLLSPGTWCSCPLPHDLDGALPQLMRRLLAARRSLDLCVFTFSSAPLGRAVLLLHGRGVRVRVITDSDYMAASGSQIGALRKAGVEVRHSQSSGFMHHKFSVVDKSIVITGSMNWTMQAIQTNRENLLITDDGICVRAYMEEFERLWEEYDPASYSFFPEEDEKGP
ncbi:mitochondrial cardiolipin hydrolase [Bufo gargarizans]|uniref:mitochondrial cardiolipin hydrolase n=1 Tax=Bufo gargarizans TaxID=30331 RepID=UPI001CF183F4|nr:mitochondrial cardiolipin hydrolase [Bufo gargarizans]